MENERIHDYQHQGTRPAGTPDYTSESLIIYNHVTNEKAFIGEEIRKQGIIVTETCLSRFAPG
ncbi:MAG: hypothetical protein ACLTZT_18995 [Butyricimonas faecalis]